VLVEVVPCLVIPPRCPGIRVSCRVLHIPEAFPGVERQGQADGPGTATSTSYDQSSLWRATGGRSSSWPGHSTVAVGESR
jgi:hypothetical protein